MSYVVIEWQLALMGWRVSKRLNTYNYIFCGTMSHKSEFVEQCHAASL